MALNDMTDRNLGGFKGAPKFPHPVETFFILPKALARKTKIYWRGFAKRLKNGGPAAFMDHIGGGVFSL